MGAQGLPGTVILCCSIPEDLEAAEVAARLEAVAAAAAPVTWLAAPGRLGAAVERGRASREPRGFAVCIPGGCQPSGLRRIVAEARSHVAGLDAVVVHGGERGADHRLLSESGIRVVYRDAATAPAKSGRRPAPRGWKCHSPAWGLWEVWRDESAVPPGGWLRTWGRAGNLRHGGLAVVDLAHDAPGGRAAATIRGRLARWTSWAGRPGVASSVRFALLSDVPDLVAAACGMAAGGSVLRAA
jgi:hypothetical protein